MKTDASSPEKKIKDEIREAYAKTYPNCIFSLTNHIERLKAELATKDEALSELIEMNRRDELTDPDRIFTEHGREMAWKGAQAALSPPTGKVLVDAGRETIARWLGWKGLQWQNLSGGGKIWRGDLLGVRTDSGPGEIVPDFSTNITLWHGDDGLLQKIEDENVWGEFLYEVGNLVDPEDNKLGNPYKQIRYHWALLKATPSQLTAALVAAINGYEEDSDESWKCPVCENTETWFDRSVSYCGGIQEGPTTRCAGCGRDVDETVTVDDFNNDDAIKGKAVGVNNGCPLHETSSLGYMASHADAEERMDRGEEQRRCPECGLWIWESEFVNQTPADCKHITR